MAGLLIEAIESGGGYLSACKRRSYQVLVPYFVWSLLRWFLSGCQLDRLALIITNPDSYFWFLWILFWICVIFIGCQWIADKLKIDELFPVGTACVVLMGTMVALEFRLFGFQFLSYYFLFYTLGYCIHRFEVLQLKNNFIIVVFIMVWAFLAWGWKMHGLPSWIPAIPQVPDTLLQYAYRGLTALIGVMVLIGIAPKLLNGNSRFNYWMKDIGEVSLGLYVVHLTFMGYIKELLFTLTPNISTWCAISIPSLVSFFVSIIIVNLLNKNRWTSRICLGKVF